MGTLLAIGMAVERVMKRNRHQRVVIAATAAMMAGLSTLLNNGVAAEGRSTEQSFIQRVIAQTTRTGLAIRSIREMNAGTVSGKHKGWMRVATTLTPAGAFSWSVIEEGGSSRTREKVFRAVLETEAASSRDGNRDAAALTPDNYQFTRIGEGRDGEVQIRLEPRRKDAKLIEGVLTVSADGYPVRLEGTLAKSPSFWVKSVHVVKQYGRFAGVALPTVVESSAELKLFGKSTFTMRYIYQEVNGRIFSAAAATADANQ
jgi:hypothetical protein